MDKLVNEFNEKVKQVDEMVKESDMAMAEMRLQFATLARMQKDERIEMQKMHKEERLEMQKEHEKIVAHWKHIVIGLILTICLIIGGVIGTVGYFLTNFDFTFETYQDVYSDNSGTAIIYDGIHTNSD